MTGKTARIGPHQDQAVVTMGRPLGEATAAVVMVHGRGATAESILELAREFGRPDLCYVAPQAAGATWYPYSFMAPMGQNEPYLSSALERIGEVLDLLERGGIPPERTVLLGFSQGACLSLEYAARNARRYGGVVGLSGGLIGPAGTPRDYERNNEGNNEENSEGGFEGTPVFLGCSDRDPHIPRERVDESAEVMREMGAEVTERIYPAMGHTVNMDEIEFVRGILASL
jgi:predicted esterase